MWQDTLGERFVMTNWGLSFCLNLRILLGAKEVGGGGPHTPLA